MIVAYTKVYLQYETFSTVRKEIHENFTFPALSICDSNYFKTPQASQYLESLLSQKYGVNVTNFDEYYNAFNGSISPVAWTFYETFFETFNDTLRRSFGYSLNDTMIKCEFDSKPCDLNWFDWFYHPFFGNCYKFNSGSLNGSKYF